MLSPWISVNVSIVARISLWLSHSVTEPGALLQGLAKALGFLAGYVFISLPAYHRCKGAIRIVYLGLPFQIFC